MSRVCIWETLEMRYGPSIRDSRVQKAVYAIWNIGGIAEEVGGVE